MAAEQTGIWDQPAAPSATREAEDRKDDERPRWRPATADEAASNGRGRTGLWESLTGRLRLRLRLRQKPSRRAAPSSAGGRQRARRSRKVRRVHRVIRHVEVWSVFKVASLFAVCAYVVVLISGFLLWRAADRVGTISGIEGFFEEAGGYDRFELYGDVVFRSAALLLAIFAGLAVFAAVLGAVLFNLISDLTGGIRMTVIDEDLIVTPVRRRGGADKTSDSDLEPSKGTG